jgi:hypothetical protein
MKMFDDGTGATSSMRFLMIVGSFILIIVFCILAISAHINDPAHKIPEGM